jgi:hypothetical protein
MSTKEFQHLLELHLKALKTQRQHMPIVRDNHENWIIKIDDVEINCIRRETIDLIGKTVEHYNELLEALHRQGFAARKTTTTEEEGMDQP